MGTPLNTIAGSPPVCTSLAFRHWMDRASKALDDQVIKTPATIYYFSQSGNDTTGNGTQGNPWRTIAKAITELAAWSSTSAGLGLYFNRGDTWRGEAILHINKNHVVVRAYGDASKPKPRFTRWAGTYGNGGWSATAGKTRTYERTEATAVRYIREVDDVHYPYIRCASLDEIEEAIARLPADARRQLVQDLPALCPEVFPPDGWAAILRDESPRPALKSLLDKLDAEYAQKPESFLTLNDKTLSDQK